MNTITSENIYQHSGAVDDNQLTRLGIQAGVNYIMAIKMAQQVVNIRMLDVTTGEIMRSRSRLMNTGGGFRGIESSVAELIGEFLEVETSVLFTDLKDDLKREQQIEREEERKRREIMKENERQQKQREKDREKEIKKSKRKETWGKVGAYTGLVLLVAGIVALASLAEE